MYRLIQGECIEELDKLIKEGVKVDTVICDLPYGTTGCEWDEVIDFGELWERIHKIAPGAPVVLFGKQPFTTKMISSNIREFREDITWLKNKSGNGFKADQRHIHVTEDIVVFSESGVYTYNPQKWLVEGKEFLTQRKTFKEVEVGNNIYGKMTRKRKPDTGERNPINIVTARVPFTGQKGREYSKGVDLRYHPTQKPIKLLDYLVDTYSNEGDTVLDMTMGSGTTGVSAVKKGRKFIGIDISGEYVGIADKRISEVLEDGNNK